MTTGAGVSQTSVNVAVHFGGGFAPDVRTGAAGLGEVASPNTGFWADQPAVKAVLQSLQASVGGSETPKPSTGSGLSGGIGNAVTEPQRIDDGAGSCLVLTLDIVENMETSLCCNMFCGIFVVDYSPTMARCRLQPSRFVLGCLGKHARSSRIASL